MYILQRLTIAAHYTNFIGLCYLYIILKLCHKHFTIIIEIKLDILIRIDMSRKIPNFTAIINSFFQREN